MIAVVVTAIDALSKIWARHALAHHADPRRWRDLAATAVQLGDLVLLQPDRGPLLTTVATIVVALVVVAVGLRARGGLATVGFGLLIGGGVANVVDRLSASPHQVTDFIALGSFPVFNLADVAITAGFITLLVAALTGEKLLA